MNTRQKHVYLPAVITAGSLIVIALLVLLTSPIINVAYSIIFFSALAIFLSALGYLVLYLQNGQVSPRSQLRLVIISILLITMLMLRSTQSLSWGDIVVLLIISLIMLFYSGRRIY